MKKKRIDISSFKASSSNDPLSVIQKKHIEQEKKLNDMKDNIKMLNEITTASSIKI